MTDVRAMPRRRLGRSQVAVTELGCGGAPIGNLYAPVDDDTVHAALIAAWEGGVRYFDTAPHYGLGLSERRLGAALAGRPRDEYVVSTKVGRLLVQNPSPTGSDLASGFAVHDDLTRQLDYSRDGALRSLEASLTRLGLDRVDILFVHDPDDHLDQAIREAIPALVELREQKVIGALGAGMNYWQPLLRIVTETDVDAVMLAGRWTLADRSGAPLVAACEERGVSVMAAGPFNSGLLSRSWPADDAHFNYAPAPPEILDRARALATACDQYGAQLPQAALRFPLRRPAVASVVAGIRTPTQARADVEAMAAGIPQQLWGVLDGIALH